MGLENKAGQRLQRHKTQRTHGQEEIGCLSGRTDRVMEDPTNGARDRKHHEMPGVHHA